jgi:hypothetical protein
VIYTTFLSRFVALALLFAGASPTLPHEMQESTEPTANEASRVDTQKPLDASGMSDRVQRADDYLQPRLLVWQKRLKLSGWKITMVQAKLSELRPGTLGNIHWDDADKTAKIRVLAASEYKISYELALKDMECTLVHELVHLELAQLPRSDASREEEEHAVVDLSEALLALERGE